MKVSFALALAATSLVSTARAEPELMPFALRSIELAGDERELVRPEFGAVSPLLAARLDKWAVMVAGLAQTSSFGGRAQEGEARSGSCTVGFETTAFVSFVCVLSFDSQMAGTAWIHTTANLYIDGDRLRPLQLSDLFGTYDWVKGLSAVAKLGDGDGTLDTNCALLVSPDGLACYRDSEGPAWTIALADFESHLVPGNPYALTTVDGEVLVSDRFEPPDRTPRSQHARLRKARSALPAQAQRFIARSSGVYDRLTGLEWQAADNGADVTFEEAKAYVRALPAAEGDAWRLPTEVELHVLSDFADSHKDPADCTHGKSLFALTPLIRASCGLAWAQDAHAFGFLSGTGRVSRPTDKKNYRALAVRDARFRASPDGGRVDAESKLVWRSVGEARTAPEVGAKVRAGQRLPTSAEARDFAFAMTYRDLDPTAHTELWVDDGKGPTRLSLVAQTRSDDTRRLDERGVPIPNALEVLTVAPATAPATAP